MERIREELKEGEKHDQNILYDKFFFKKIKTENQSEVNSCHLGRRLSS